MTTDRQRATEFWDRETIASTHTSWMAEPDIRMYINGRIGGEYGPCWPVEWFEQWHDAQQPAATPRFARALSVGCGEGALERQLVTRKVCGRVDAFDASLSSLHAARKASQEQGLSDRIRYFAADFNQLSLPHRVYDAVFFHQSLHHVGKLEKLFRSVLSALQPAGVLYLDEYVGPSRTDWNPALLRAQRRVYAALPARIRTRADVPFPIQEDDPSEAIRSSEILPLLRTGFEVVAQRDYGGGLLAVLYPHINWDEAPQSLATELIAEERAVEIPGSSYYTVAVARPRKGLGRILAVWKYWLVPKLRRLRWEALHRLGSVSVRY